MQTSASSKSPPGSTPTRAGSPVNLDRLLKLRLVVARFGEMDRARWWNTSGQLGRVGALALQRGFPRTHRFAQARAVFAVAAHRCRELFDPPGCATLWSLPEAIEEEFDAQWEVWLDDAKLWEPFFKQLAEIPAGDLLVPLRALGNVTDREIEAASRLRRSAEGRAVPLPGVFSGTDEEIAQLALGFARGEEAAPAVPYSRRE